MTLRRAWLVVALLALSACFDSIVGSECAEGYSPCGSRCVRSGTCAAVDAAVEAAPSVDAQAVLDAATSDVETVVDAGVADDGGALDLALPSDDVAAVLDVEDDVPVALDLGSGQPSDAADGVGIEDVPLPDDTPIGPILEDAAVDQEAIDLGLDVENETGGCLDCLDAENGEAASGVDAEGIDVGPLVCVDPTVNCNEQCVDVTIDPENCGACSTICASGVCIDRSCLVCGADETVCGRQCINTFTDPDNCGGCGVPCASGLCSNGVCEAAGTGHAIVIGHDYFRNRPAMNRILGNAVFLWPVNPVQVLAYEGTANATAIVGANGAIAQVANATGRQWTRTVAAAADVPSLLAGAHVFLIYGQESADDATLTQLGTDWASALSTFVNAGGTLIILDGAYEGNGGTSQILSQAGLFMVARNLSVTNDVCAVVARGDALASGLPRTYLCELNSTSLTVTDSATTLVTSVVEVSGQSVVVHKVF